MLDPVMDSLLRLRCISVKGEKARGKQRILIQKNPFQNPKSRKIRKIQENPPKSRKIQKNPRKSTEIQKSKCAQGM